MPKSGIYIDKDSHEASPFQIHWICKPECGCHVTMYVIVLLLCCCCEIEDDHSFADLDVQTQPHIMSHMALFGHYDIVRLL